MAVRLQAIIPDDIKHVFSWHIKSIFENYDYSGFDTEYHFFKAYCVNLKTNKVLIGFDIDYNELEKKDLEKILKDIYQFDFVDALLKFNSIDFEDEYPIEEINIFKKLYSLEINLREIFSYIFIQEYPNRVFDFLHDYKIKPQKYDVSKAKKNFENEISYLLFSDYKNLNVPEAPKIEDVLNVINNYDNVKDIRDALKKGISIDKYINFIAGLNDSLSKLEQTRNALMHYRNIPSDNKEFFDAETLSLSEYIKNFWQNEKDDGTILKFLDGYEFLEKYIDDRFVDAEEYIYRDDEKDEFMHVENKTIYDKYDIIDYLQENLGIELPEENANYIKTILGDAFYSKA